MTLQIEYPASLPDALHQTRAEFEQQARLALAVKLFEMRKLPSGKSKNHQATQETDS
ncbi:MAG: UPF0175 family protein [Verrucomicrobia bacterium]|nr:UPF0175 family protein [Verrucomicrobiota bacterium]